MTKRKIPTVLLFAGIVVGIISGYGVGYTVYQARLTEAEDKITLLEKERSRLVQHVEYIGAATVSGKDRNLELSMTVDKTVVSVGDSIKFVLTLRNKGNERVTLTFGSPLEFDVALFDAHGEFITSRWSGYGFTAVIHEVTLEPQATLSETFRWDLANPNEKAFVPIPGEYSISGVLCGYTTSMAEPIQTDRISITVS